MRQPQTKLSQALALPPEPPLAAPEVATVAIHRLTLQFADPELEADYRAAHLALALPFGRSLAAIVALFCVVLWALMRAAFNDVPGLVDYIGWVGLATSLTMGALLLCSYRPWFAAHLQQIGGAFSVLTGGVLGATGMAFGPTLAVSYGYALGMLHVINIFGVMRLRLPIAAMAAVLSLVFYLAMVAAGGLPPLELARHATFMALAGGFGALTLYRTERSERLEFLARHQLARERLKSEALLLNILPGAIAERLKAAGQPIADGHPQVSVLFADLVGFTQLSARLPATELVDLLNQVFSEFDTIADRHGLEKIKTIGDAYMAVCGLPVPRENHAAAVVRAADEMVRAVARFEQQLGVPLAVRVGLHAGPVVAGVIGKRKFSYDLWGDTVNLASRMESHGAPGRLHCTAEFAALLGDEFACEPRGAIEVKGKGSLQTCWVAVARSMAPN